MRAMRGQLQTWRRPLLKGWGAGNVIFLNLVGIEVDMKTMRRFRKAILVLFITATAVSGECTADEVQDFVITPSAPPTPALKYKLLFDSTQRQPGNAAVYYEQAMEFSDEKLYDQVEKATDELQRGDERDFMSIMGSVLPRDGMMDKIECGAMCTECDWQPEIRQRGFAALLPYLNHAREIANFLSATSEYQTRGGAIDQSVATLRMGYELARGVNRDPVIVSGLVGVGISRLMNQALCDLMRRPEAPNLYWALATFPSVHPFLANDGTEEQTFLAGQFHKLADYSPDDLSGDDWQAILDGAAEFATREHNPNAPPRQLDLSSQARSVDLPDAQKYYADTRQLPPDQAEHADWTKVLGIYYYEQYQAALQDNAKYLNLPYPQILAGLDRAWANALELKKEHPANPFLYLLPNLTKAALTDALADRELAALTDVEAIRSYAAANGNQLPARLQDINDTPPLDNPLTTKPFDYRVDGGTATISDDHAPDHRLKYTVRIQQ
jgi:hypothetical protein